MLGVNKISQEKARVGIGLDIGVHSLKIVEIAGLPDKPHLASAGQKRIVDSSSIGVSDAIKSLVESSAISSKEVAISISGPSVVVRFISMPKMSDDELAGAIRFEAEKFVPFNINDCVFDYQRLGTSERENKINILLVAAKKDAVMEKVAIVQNSGLTVRLVDVDSFALANIFFKNFAAYDPEKTVAVLNIGPKLTNLIIVRGGVMRLVRDMSIGDCDFSAAIAKELNVDLAAADGLKVLPGDRAIDTINALKPVFGSLTDDMRLPLSYYENQYGRNVDEIYICGDGSCTAGIDEAIKEAFGLKPVSWNPVQFLEAQHPSGEAAISAQCKPAFAIAAGLALR